MSSILSELIQEFNKTAQITDTVINDWINDYAYQGMNVEVMLKELRDKVNTHGITTYRNLVAIGLFRGNMVSKIASTMPDNKRFLTWVKNFNIKESVTRASDKKVVFTLSRLRILTPQIAAEILVFSSVPRPVTNSELADSFNIEKFPSVLRDSCIASLVPSKEFNGVSSEDLYAALVSIYGYCLLESGKLRTKGSSVKDILTRAEDVLKYFKTSMSSPHVTRNMREAFWNKHIMDQVEDIRLTADGVVSYLTDNGIPLPNFDF